MSLLLSLLLTLLGVLLLLASLAGVGLGLFLAARRVTRGLGLFFALWWTPAVAAAAGVLMRDPVTFAIGVFCFAVAGVAFYLESRAGHPPQKEKKVEDDKSPSERTTQKRIRTRTHQQRRAAS